MNWVGFDRSPWWDIVGHAAAKEIPRAGIEPPNSLSTNGRSIN
jgi:hypothetical protein